MQSKSVQVFFIPGGEHDSSQAYEAIVRIMQAHPMDVSFFRYRNVAAGKWFLVLVGDVDDLNRYHEMLFQPLEAVNAQPYEVDPQYVEEFIWRYLQGQAELQRRRQPFSRKRYT